MVFGMIYESNYHFKILEIDVLLYLVIIFLPFCFLEFHILLVLIIIKNIF